MRPLLLVLPAFVTLQAVADMPPADAERARAAESRPAEPSAQEIPAVLNFTMTSLSGEPVELPRYAGRVLLIVNVASKCGYTPQYEGLQALHAAYAPKGLSVLGFPANDFGGQEPGTEEEIATFCKKNFGVEFDMFSKISVLGESKAPLYAWLTSAEAGGDASPAGDVKWNFEKFLVGRDGALIGRYSSKVAPDDPQLVKAIEAALAKQ